ncbi:MAG TPA: 4-hydroxy-3-methylbut-2-enyl diphosphate reductase [Candidatus Nanoarchaeia archaeon]|nr:4-hydroxy-3-methylbut-2-enyl diphosphate reductase [Candidatus Nanoarchaeia archaeon]
MEVKVARQYGFCFGVRRAIQLADEFKGELTTYGPLVHNPFEVKRLEERGIQSTLEIAQIKTPNILVRAHGIAPDVMQELKEKGNVIDGTCPLVKKVHGIAQMLDRSGYTIFIFGQKNHPETIGTQGYIGNKAIVVHDAEEARKVSGEYQKVALISQTTEIIDEFHEIENILKEKYPNLRVIDTICQPTKENQNAAIELARESDFVIVVGGRNSSNSKKLTLNCAKITRAVQIENPQEIDNLDFSNVKVLGLTAGASTPDWLFDEVVARAKEIAQKW